MKPPQPKSPPRSAARGADTISHRKSPPPEGGTPNAPRSQIILLAVTGMSPAVLTETLWALAKENPPVIPDRIVVMTTTVGSEQLQKTLFKPQSAFDGRCPFDGLRDWMEQGGHEVSGRLRYEERIIRRWNDRRREYELLPDIRDRSDNEAAADFIIEQVRSFAEADDTQIVATIAGGRKTMGALLYACMTVLGREHDRLTHVLVNEPYETGVGGSFFFPDQPAQRLQTRDGKPLAARDARVELADVPFVPLRNLFERDLVKRRGTFTALVNACRKEVADQLRRQVNLVVYRSRPQIEVNGVPVKLSSKQHLFLLLLAERTAQRQPPFSKYAEAVEHLRELGEKLYAERNPDNFNDWLYSVRLPPGADEQTFRKLRDELIHKLESKGPAAVALIPFLPQSGRCSLDLPPTTIAFRD